MVLFLASLVAGLVLAVSFNFPEIWLSVSDRAMRHHVGTAFYLTSTSLWYGAIVWLAAFGLIELIALLFIE